MTSNDLAILISCARQLLGTDAAAKSPASEVIKAWQAVAACEAHGKAMADQEKAAADSAAQDAIAKAKAEAKG